MRLLVEFLLIVFYVTLSSQQNRGVDVKSFVRYPLPKMHTCPSSNIIERDGNSVCGSDGITYVSDNELGCYRKMGVKDLVKVRDGPCTWVAYEDYMRPACHRLSGPNERAKKRKDRNDLDVESFGVGGELFCSTVVQSSSPICGSDGYTYQNEFDFECSIQKNMMRGKFGLYKVKDGPCQWVSYEDYLKKPACMRRPIVANPFPDVDPHFTIGSTK